MVTLTKGNKYHCIDPQIKYIEIIHIDPAAKRPVMAILESFEGKKWKASYDLNGHWIGLLNYRRAAYDIVADIKESPFNDVYANIYRREDGKLYIGGLHQTRQAAHQAIEDTNKVSCIKFRLMPGVWDD